MRLLSSPFFPLWIACNIYMKNLAEASRVPVVTESRALINIEEHDSR
jgi:hypothetical protein